MPNGPLAHVCFLVKDLDRAVEDWTKILSVLDPAQVQEPVVRYEDFEGGHDTGMRWATFVTHQGMEIQMIQPAPDTPLGRRLTRIGEHIHHLCFTTPNLEADVEKLRQSGIKLKTDELLNDPGMPWQHWTWVSAESAHGVMLEVARPYESHHDGKWHPSRLNEALKDEEPLMSALMLQTPNGPESTQMVQVERPKPKAGEVRVALKSASLNHRELWITRGQYPGMVLPAVLGADGAGVIESVGPGVGQEYIGREVVLYPAAYWGDNPEYPTKAFSILGMPLPGTLAEFICVPAKNLALKPACLSFEEAACVPLTGVTAWRALTVKARLKPGEKVLVTGIGGGVAVWALKFAVALGAEVYVTSSSEDKIRLAQALGARGGVNYKNEKWGKELAQLSGGIDVVIDGAPAGSYAEYARAINFGARVVMYGSTGGAQFKSNAPELFLKHASIIGTAMGTLEDFTAMLEFVESRKLKPVIDKSFPLAQAREALLALENAHHMGKITITMS